MFPGCWRVGWLLVLPRVVHWKQYHSHLEVVGGGGGGGGVEWGLRGRGESLQWREQVSATDSKKL